MLGSTYLYSLYSEYMLVLTLCLVYAFSALTLLVGWHEGHLACKNWVVRYWRGYLSGARCKWFAYGPADVTVTPSSLALVKSRMVYRSGASLCQLPQVVPEKKWRLTDVVVVVCHL